MNEMADLEGQWLVVVRVAGVEQVEQAGQGQLAVGHGAVHLPPKTTQQVQEARVAAQVACIQGKGGEGDRMMGHG